MKPLQVTDCADQGDYVYNPWMVSLTLAVAAISGRMMFLHVKKTWEPLKTPVKMTQSSLTQDQDADKACQAVWEISQSISAANLKARNRLCTKFGSPERKAHQRHACITWRP